MGGSSRRTDRKNMKSFNDPHEFTQAASGSYQQTQTTPTTALIKHTVELTKGKHSTQCTQTQLTQLDTACTLRLNTSAEWHGVIVSEDTSYSVSGASGAGNEARRRTSKKSGNVRCSSRSRCRPPPVRCEIALVWSDMILRAQKCTSIAKAVCQ